MYKLNIYRGNYMLKKVYGDLEDNLISYIQFKIYRGKLYV